VVADRGMISAATLQALEERKLEYILGARERSTAVIRDVVLADETPFTPLLIERRRGETQLFAKEVRVNGARYIVCRNEAEAEKDRVDRQAIIAGLKLMVEKLRREIYGQRSERKARLLDQLELQLEEQEALIMCPTVALAAGIICPTVAIAASSTCTSTTAPAWVSEVKEARTRWTSGSAVAGGARLLFGHTHKHHHSRNPETCPTEATQKIASCSLLFAQFLAFIFPILHRLPPF